MSASVPASVEAAPPAVPGSDVLGDEDGDVSQLLKLLESATGAAAEGEADGELAGDDAFAALQEVLQRHEGAQAGGDDAAEDDDAADGAWPAADEAGGPFDETIAERGRPFRDEDADDAEPMAYDDDGSAGYGEDADDDEPLVEVRSGVLPYEVWMQTHAARAAASSGGARSLETPVLSERQWDHLVTRLNESSKRKQQALAAMQAKREADELEGAHFTPAISRRSKQIARANKRLPERVRALVERRQRKQDKLREEAQQREMAEATFKPKLSRPVNARMAHLMGRMRRSVKHLLRYDVDKQIRARQRQQIMQEVEASELTFSPRINPNSDKIFRRMRRRVEATRRKLEEEGPEALTDEERAALMGRTQAARDRTVVEDQMRHLATLEAGVRSGQLRKVPLGRDGLSKLPGHEEERFHPRINRRSRLIRPDGRGGADVHERLYTKSTEAHARRTEERRAKAQRTLRMARTKSSAAIGVGNSADGLRLGAVGLRGEGIAAGGAAGAAAGGGPGRVNVVEYKPGYDFIVRLAAQAAREEEALDAHADGMVEEDGFDGL